MGGRVIIHVQDGGLNKAREREERRGVERKSHFIFQSDHMEQDAGKAKRQRTRMKVDRLEGKHVIRRHDIAAPHGAGLGK